jgi:hypothetical protein
MKGKKLAVGAALIAVPSLALAAPAAADRSSSDTSSSDVPAFAYQDNILFCTVSGFSSFAYDEETDRTVVRGESSFRGSANTSQTNHDRCRQALAGLTVTVHWIDDDDKLHGTSSTATASFIETRGEGPGNITEVNGNHSVNFWCDAPNGGLTICSHNVGTSPSTK